MKMNLPTAIFVFGVVMFFILGCGMFNKSQITNKQISDDLIANGIITKDKSSFDFAGKYSTHCFKVDKSEVSNDAAEIFILATGTEVQSGGDGVKIMMGDIALSYKKNGNEWKLQNVNPTSFNTKEVSLEDAMKFSASQKSICSAFERAYSDKSN